METIVKPLRDADEVLQRPFRDLLSSSEVQLVPATRTLREAAAVNLKPGALHAVTSILIQERCASFVTKDARRRRGTIPQLGWE